MRHLALKFILIIAVIFSGLYSAAHFGMDMPDQSIACDSCAPQTASCALFCIASTMEFSMPASQASIQALMAFVLIGVVLAIGIAQVASIFFASTHRYIPYLRWRQLRSVLIRS